MHLPVAPGDVYDALDSSEGRAAFWAESAVERDGLVEFEFINGQRSTGRIALPRSHGGSSGPCHPYDAPPD
jgi:hypothetical protein